MFWEVRTVLGSVSLCSSHARPRMGLGEEGAEFL